MIDLFVVSLPFLPMMKLVVCDGPLRDFPFLTLFVILLRNMSRLRVVFFEDNGNSLRSSAVDLIGGIQKPVYFPA